MATSVYFNNQGGTREQLLLEDLIIESIKNHGIDVYYIPRDSQSSIDALFGDDPVKSFTKAIKIDMYLETTNDFEGNEEFFSKFGLEISKGVKMSVARRTFQKYVTKVSPANNVPKEGDLVYLPIQQKLMELKFVEQEKNFYQLGRNGLRTGAAQRVGIETSKNAYMFGLSLETFRYNGELIKTGFTEIDSIADIIAPAIEFTLQANGNATYFDEEQVYQGASFATATATAYVAAWNKPSRILTLRNIKGEFTANSTIIGKSSNAQWTLTSYDSQENANDDQDDNVLIETEADNILDFTEHNPFGEP